MRWRGLAELGASTAAIAGLLACSSDARPGVGLADGTAGRAGASNLGGAAGSVGSSAPAGTAGTVGTAGSSACPENPSPQRTQGTVVSFPLQLVLLGKPFVFGQPNMLADGGSLVPLNLRFYISEVELLRSGEEPVAVDIVTASGAPEPYGVHLFNAEEADSSALRVLAPPGQYTGLAFALGLKLACNQQAPAGLTEPLSGTSQMTWPHTAGFLFFRYEGRYSGAGGAGGADGGGGAGAGSAPGIPAMVHMGGSVTAERVPRLTVPGAFSVPASGTLEKGLSVVMAEIFKGASAELDVSDVAVGVLSSPEAIAGERLRRQLPELQAFVLDEP